MTEEEERLAVVAEAKTWIGTPYVSNGLVKGRRGGTDCGMLLVGVFRNVGLIPSSFDPRPYPAQWHLHQDAEKYLEKILGFAAQSEAPPRPGDIVMFKFGRVFSHGGIVTAWPYIIHAVGNDSVLPEDISRSTTGKRAFWSAEKRFYSYWGRRS